ncbi:hypothetical protein AK88_00372 [Plasmodium fragile]|uniref:Uncharacterized protein n=1 Tax=Plasmodium fragile TaxID=5857 RepID=A0A0D9QU75_PLAFR|nr:uncharacterized protein AK88_00372 [Plasmodium fragile]KJP89916.1 hypothetical protein AK88_00372 [Plasmodium fragile]
MGRNDAAIPTIVAGVVDEPHPEDQQCRSGQNCANGQNEEAPLGGARTRRLNSYHEEAIASENIYRIRRSASSVSGTSTWKEKIRRTLLSDQNGDNPITHEEFPLNVNRSHQMRSESVGQTHLGGSMGNVFEEEQEGEQEEEHNKSDEFLKGSLSFCEDNSEHKRNETFSGHAENVVDPFEDPMELKSPISSTSRWHENSSSEGEAFAYNDIGSSVKRDKGDESTFEGISPVDKCGEEDAHLRCDDQEQNEKKKKKKKYCQLGEEDVITATEHVDRKFFAGSDDSSHSKEYLHSKQSEQVNVLTTEATRGWSAYAEMWSENCAGLKPHQMDEHTSEHEVLSGENAKLVSENEALSGENARLSSENETLNEENARLWSENEVLSEENAKLSSENEVLSEENARLSSENEVLTGEKAQLSSEMEELKREEEKHRRENGQLQEELTQLRADVEEAREARELEVNLKLLLQTEQEELQKKCERLEKDKEALTTEKMNNVLRINNLKEELNRQGKCMKELTQELREKEEEIEVHKGELTTMEKTLNEMKEKMEQLNNQIKIHVKNEKDNERRVDVLQEEVQQCAGESHQVSGEECKGDKVDDTDTTQREEHKGDIPQGSNVVALDPLNEKIQQSNDFIQLLKGQKESSLHHGDDNKEEKKLFIEDHQLLCEEIDSLGVDDLKERCKRLACHCTQLLMQLQLCANGGVGVAPALQGCARSAEVMNEQGDSARGDGTDAAVTVTCSCEGSVTGTAKQLMVGSKDECKSIYKEILRRTSEIAKHVNAVKTKLCTLKRKSCEGWEDSEDYSDCLVLLNSISADIFFINRNVSLMGEQSRGQPDGQPDCQQHDQPSDLLNPHQDDAQITASPEEPPLCTQLPSENVQKGSSHPQNVELKMEDANHLTCSENFVTFFEICFSSDLFLILCHVCKGVLEICTWARKGEEENCLQGVQNLLNYVAQVENLCTDDGDQIEEELHGGDTRGDPDRGPVNTPSCGPPKELFHVMRTHLHRLAELMKKDKWTKRTHEVMHELCNLRNVLRLVLYTFVNFHGLHWAYVESHGDVLQRDTSQGECVQEVNLVHLANRVVQHNHNAHLVPCLIAQCADDVILEGLLGERGMEGSAMRGSGVDGFVTQMSNYTTNIFKRISERMKWNELIISGDSFVTYFDEGALKSKLKDNPFMHKNKKINIDTVYEHLGVLLRPHGTTHTGDSLFGEYFKTARSLFVQKSLSCGFTCGRTPYMSSALENTTCFSCSVPPHNLFSRDKEVHMKSASFSGDGVHGRMGLYFKEVSPLKESSSSKQHNHLNSETGSEYPLIRVDNECVSSLFHMWHAMEKKFFFKIGRSGGGPTCVKGERPACVNRAASQHAVHNKVKPDKGEDHHPSAMDSYLRSMIYDSFQCTDENKQIGVNHFIFLLTQLGIQVRDSELHALWCIMTGKRDVNKAMKETIPVSTFIKKAYSTNPSLVFYEHCKAKVKLREAQQNLKHLRRYNRKLLLLVNSTQQDKQLRGDMRGDIRGATYAV